MSTDRPNILLVTTDQQRFDTVASHGNPYIDTPHLDWLADEGISYRRAYADCPICMPSRATIMTGMAGYTLGLTGNKTGDFPLADHDTLPSILGRAGYQTRAQGKMHFHPVRAHYGFQTMELPMDYYRERHRLASGAAGLPKEHGVGENEMHAVISTVHENESLTHWTVSRSIDFLETRDPTRPFFLWTSFTKPHPPFDPPANYWALYANRTVGEPVTGDWSTDVATMPQSALAPTYQLNNVHRFSAEQLANARRAYYACITHIDYSLGMLFARMRELGLLENTWIVFTSDHGENLGDHNMGGKSNFLEGSARVPLIVRPPAGPWEEKPLAGKTVDTPVSLADVMPTLLAIAGLEEDAGFAGAGQSEDGPAGGSSGRDGRNLLAFLEAPEPDRVVVGESGDFLAVIGSRYKYHYFVRGGDELLFDLADDPHEQRNLASPGQRTAERDAVIETMRARLVDALAKAGRRFVKGGELLADPPVAGPEEVRRWPGFHSTVVETDVLH